MRVLKILGLISALTPVAYCAQLVLHLSDFVEPSGPGHSGSWWRHAADSGLAPTLIGLSAVGLMFAVAFVLKLLGALRSGPSGAPPSRRTAARPPAADGEADAEAMIARYLAKQPADPARPAPAHRPPPAPARRFGNRTG